MSRHHDARELKAEGLHLRYDRELVVHGIDIEIPAGKITVIVGANGSGKSTTLRGLSRLLKPSSGSVTLDGHDIHSMPAKKLAQMIGLLPQHPTAPDGITVADLVSRGRHPHHTWIRRRDHDDDAVVAAALRATSMIEFADRPVDQLSGGQRQRVWIAMALAQDPDILLLDEPTTYLDLTHQIELLDLLTELNTTYSTTVVMVLHDLNLAARYADHLLVMAAGRVAGEGMPRDVLTPGMLSAAFGLESLVIDDPATSAPLIVPIGRFHCRPHPSIQEAS
ncbi:ABC transporter ATP-binding protein [Acrocarpospora macrocephala]|uniref:ABC transporter ATP-binding protein n=1 Tax=Acrocarpospora macrocephala TaxID=150177 RepID=A0A5M3WRL8_9ACTN|nr:ABC transporter ATP-binding protein [Acrocarpospora macrocephala]GES08828.1 ABC transporter ATP-binding protein [Acrocarpospora macrocephala]